MNRYGVYPGNTSASTSTTGEPFTSDEESDYELDDADSREGSLEQPDPDPVESKANDPTEDDAAKQSESGLTASTPVYEIPDPPLFPLNPMALSPAVALPSQSGNLTPMERFAFNALIEYYCSQQVRMYIPSHYPQEIHDRYKRELYQRVISAMGMKGFDRDEFSGIREEMLMRIGAVVNTEISKVLQSGPTSPSMSPSIEYPAAPQPTTGMENFNENQVVKIHRPRSFDNLAPLAFLPPNHTIVPGAERPATSDGRKVGDVLGVAAAGEPDRARYKRRPEILRAMSFDTLHQQVGGVAISSPSAGPGRGSSGYFSGYKTPQPKTPINSTYPFRFRPSGPSGPPRDAELSGQFSSGPPRGIPGMKRSRSHISAVDALKASHMLQRTTVQNLSPHQGLSTLHYPQPLPPSHEPLYLKPSLETVFTTTSRYKTDFMELGFLGKGGFASVYKVRNHLDGREYAIKKVPIRYRHLYSERQDKLEGIFNEIKTLAKLEHTNVVRYYSAWIEGAKGLWETHADTHVPTQPMPVSAAGALSCGDIKQGTGTKEFATTAAGKREATPMAERFPVFNEAIFDKKEFDDPFNTAFSSESMNDDSMEIHFGDDTTNEDDGDSDGASNGGKSKRAKVESDDSDDELDDSDEPSKDTVEDRTEQILKEEVLSDMDVEIIPRLLSPTAPYQIPLPISPQYQPDHLRARRRSFVSAVDAEGNEMPYPESYATGGSFPSSPASGNMSEVGSPRDPQQAVTPQEKPGKEFLENLRKHKAKRERSNAISDTEESSGGSEESGDSDTATLNIYKRNSRKKGYGERSRRAYPEIRSSSKTSTAQADMRALVKANRMARRASDRREILTLMIMMSLHPFTLKDFLLLTEDDPTLGQHDYGFAHPTERNAILKVPKHAPPDVKEEYCWHMPCALLVFKGILEGAEYLHRNGVVHRDLKPGNIFLNIEAGSGPRKDGECRYCDKGWRAVPKIGDFGLVAELCDGVSVRRESAGKEAEDGEEIREFCEEYLRGGLVGTALYRPPPSGESDREDVCSSADEEGHVTFMTTKKKDGSKRGKRLRDNIICPKTDVYALGIILFELLYRCDTVSERVKCLVELREGGRLPGDWGERVGGVSGGKENEIVDGQDEQRRDVVERVGRCVLGMTARRRRERWGLQRVKEELGKLEEWR